MGANWEPVIRARSGIRVIAGETLKVIRSAGSWVMSISSSGDGAVTMHHAIGGRQLLETSVTDSRDSPVDRLIPRGIDQAFEAQAVTDQLRPTDPGRRAAR
jgi:hypothetical protein